MKKEEMQAIRNWCEQITILRNIELKTWKSAPKGVEMPEILDSDRRIQIISGIEAIAEALGTDPYIDIDKVGARRKCVERNGIKIFTYEGNENEKD